MYGNRSYGQKGGGELSPKKEKSGYYLTVNFFGRTLTLIRFGWIDADDWEPQLAPTGQMSGLKRAVYDSKLVPIPGVYRRQDARPAAGGSRTGRRTAVRDPGRRTIADLLHHLGELSGRLSRVVSDNRTYLDGCTDT